MTTHSFIRKAAEFTSILALCFCPVACTSTNTVGRDFDASKVGQIVKGKTTLTEVEALLGPPAKKMPGGGDIAGLPAATPCWFYWHESYSVKQTLSPGGTVAFLLLPTMLAPNPDMAFKSTATQVGPSKKLWVTFSPGMIVNGVKLEIQERPTGNKANAKP